MQACELSDSGSGSTATLGESAQRTGEALPLSPGFGGHDIVQPG